jgi:hypothetical protein
MITIDEIPDFLNPMPHLEILIYAKLFKSLIRKKNAVTPLRHNAVYAIPVKYTPITMLVASCTRYCPSLGQQFMHNCV